MHYISYKSKSFTICVAYEGYITVNHVKYMKVKNTTFILLFPQLGPSYPFTHVQEYENPLTTQVAPF